MLRWWKLLALLAAVQRCWSRQETNSGTRPLPAIRRKPMPDMAHNGVAMSIDQKRREEICQHAEAWAIDDAHSLYPLAEESQSVLLVWGQSTARKCGFTNV